MSGNILTAAETVISMLVSNLNDKKRYTDHDIISAWDSLRGSDSFGNYIKKGEIIKIIVEK